MRLIFGAIALTAAVVIVGYSAATLFAAAYTSMSASWAALMAGVGIAAVVAWEATAALLIGNCFRTGHYAIGMGAMLLLVLAMCLTFRYELRLHVGGQADVLAQRADAVERKEEMRSELDKARERRDALSKLLRPTPAQATLLKAERQRITELEEKWDTRTVVVAESMPEAALAARLTGWSEELWRDIWLVIPLGFWTMARVFSVPLAHAGMAAFKGREDDPGQAKAFPAVTVADVAPPPAQPQAKPVVPAVKPHLVASGEKPAETPRIRRTEDVDRITSRWLADCARAAPVNLGIRAPDAHSDYAEWCRALPVKPVSISHFGRSLRRLEVASGKTTAGAVYGLRLLSSSLRVAAA